MSGTSGSALDALDLAALLCSRVCHDLINPVGAIVNGLEVMDSSNKAEDREFALDLIRKSAESAPQVDENDHEAGAIVQPMSPQDAEADARAEAEAQARELAQPVRQ